MGDYFCGYFFLINENFCPKIKNLGGHWKELAIEICGELELECVLYHKIYFWHWVKNTKLLLVFYYLLWPLLRCLGVPASQVFDSILFLKGFGLLSSLSSNCEGLEIELSFAILFLLETCSSRKLDFLLGGSWLTLLGGWFSMKLVFLEEFPE